MPRHELAFIVAEGGVERVGSAFNYLPPIVGGNVMVEELCLIRFEDSPWASAFARAPRVEA